MSYEIWQGPSELDGSGIVVLAVDGSKNAKTGPIIQTYILRADMRPSIAAKTGHDGPICGDCPNRPRANGTCYVVPFRGPDQAWLDWDTHHKPFRIEQLRNQGLRLGAYGDPAAAPFEIWEPLIKAASTFTGFTHQWRTCDPRFKQLCMASCETPEEALEAQAAGWRTYRTTTPWEPNAKGEVTCPNVTKSLTCLACGACNGKHTGRRGNVTIPVHGSQYKIDRYIALRVEQPQTSPNRIAA